LAQWSIPLDLPSLLGSPKAHERFPKDPIVLQDIKAIQVRLLHTSQLIAGLPIYAGYFIQEIMGRFRQLSPDGSECGCMKAIILLKPGKKLRRSSK
jgi:hypothetical protein